MPESRNHSGTPTEVFDPQGRIWDGDAAKPVVVSDSIPDDIFERLGARRLTSISTAPAPSPLIGRLDPQGHTIQYGAGGVGKGILTAQWIAQLVADGHRVLLIDYENHEGEWARRIRGIGGPDAMGGVLYVAPYSAEWKGARGPIWELVPDLLALATADGSTYVVIDSIVAACGIDPLKPEAASQYATTLQRIGRPTLSLGHVTKADDLRYPFGSVFWHNLARVTWSLASAGDGALLVNRKANNYLNLGRFVVTVTYRDGLPREVRERPFALAMADRIGEVLADGALTVKEIVSALSADAGEGDEVKANSVRRALTRGAQDIPQRFEQDGERWRVKR